METRYRQRWHAIVEEGTRITSVMPVPGGVVLRVIHHDGPTCMTSTFIPDVSLMRSPERTEPVDDDAEEDGELPNEMNYCELRLVFNGTPCGQLREKGWEML